MGDPDGCGQAADVHGGTVRVDRDRVDPIGAGDRDRIGRAVSGRAAKPDDRSFSLAYANLATSVPPTGRMGARGRALVPSHDRATLWGC